MDKTTKSLQIEQIQLKNFRCFTNKIIEIDNPCVVIDGANGLGKTTVLEALYYGCYLRSFRTHLPRELIRFGNDNFFIKINIKNQVLESTMVHEIQVGFSLDKRLVKVDRKSVTSYKELLDHYRIVSLTEDDLVLIKGGPLERRSFIDQAILLLDQNYIAYIRDLRTIIDNRNKMLQGRLSDRSTYQIWTEQLWQKSRQIQLVRQEVLAEFAQETNVIIDRFFNNQFSITFEYKPRKVQLEHSYDDFLRAYPSLYEDEIRFGRSLFGAHLDDFSINFQDKRSKSYASRGQQKLTILLLKIAQIKKISEKKGPSLFLLDDFMTDFDTDRAQTVLQILASLDSQLIFTSPVRDNPLNSNFKAMGAQLILL